MSYFKNDLPSGGLKCQTESAKALGDVVERFLSNPARPTSSLTPLRVFRLAVGTTAEYTAAVSAPNAPNRDDGLRAVVIAVNHINAVYRRDVAIRFRLISGKRTIYTDPRQYTNGDTGAMVNENQRNVDRDIGKDSYDIAHAFGTTSNPFGDGYAAGHACDSSNKAMGASCHPVPTGAGFWIDFVCHEMGHQMGASHTHNGCANRFAPTAYEPGSGTSIMAYAGICGSDNIHPHSDPYFHSASIIQINDFADNIATCWTIDTSVPPNNRPSVTSAVPLFNIAPTGTPFSLAAYGSDADGDTLKFSWEEHDLGPFANLGAPDDGRIPLFRFRPPNATGERVVPDLNSLLRNQSDPAEMLPTLSRASRWVATARDGHGGTAVQTVQIQFFDGGQGPFRVTTPSTHVTWNGRRTITWNVAGTDNFPFYDQSVDISLSDDGGRTWLYTLAAGAPNTGSATVWMPNITTALARIMIRPVGAVYFAICARNFTIAPLVAPSNVVATHGTECAYVYLTCDAVGGATGYDVYRSTNSTPCSGTPLPRQPGRVYKDRNAVPGRSYYYSVRATNGTEFGPCTPGVLGFRAVCE